MMEEQYVLVPKRYLVKLEEDRALMYQIAEQKDQMLHMVDDVLGNNLTDTMWKLGNRKFKEVPKGVSRYLLSENRSN